MKIVKLMNSPQGQAGRALAGLALIAAGVLTGGTGGLVLALAGLVPLGAGATRVCLAAPLLQAPLGAR
jgi:Protein of unknown function (DUF2892)